MMIDSGRKSFVASEFHTEVHVTVSEATGAVIETGAHDFDAFYRRHPKVARDLVYILEVYKKCDRVAPTLAHPSFEEAYLHVLGGPTQAPCERCNPAFDREKRILGVPASR